MQLPLQGGRLRLARPQTSAAAGRCLASACVLARLWGHFCADKGQEEEGAGGLDVLSGSSQGRPQPPVAALPAEGAGPRSPGAATDSGGKGRLRPQSHDRHCCLSSKAGAMGETSLVLGLIRGDFPGQPLVPL